MKGFIFTFVTVVLIVALGAGGYFAIKSMTKPASYIPKTIETVGDLHSVVTDPDTGTSSVQTTVVATPKPTTPSTSSGQASSSQVTLSDNLNTMISNKVLLKLGSKGTNVGYVEQFMNLYFKKNLAIDNTFDKVLKSNVTTFQKQNKISQTGSVGTSTLQMMVLWLKNNPQ
jgi:murein L,D-transpeptidase YcbB/YkuD